MPPCLQKICIGLFFQEAESSLHVRTPSCETRFNIIVSSTEVYQFISYVHIFSTKIVHGGSLSPSACYVSNAYNRAARCLNNIWHGKPKIMKLLITCLLLLFSFTGSDLSPMTTYSLCSPVMMSDNFETHTKQQIKILRTTRSGFLLMKL